MRVEETPTDGVSIPLMASEFDGWRLNAKLLVGECVEVLSSKEGSWQHGKVVDMNPRQRTVVYTYLFKTDPTKTPNAVLPTIDDILPQQPTYPTEIPNIDELVPVSPAIDGILSEQPSPQTSKRNNIRPFPGACRLPLQPTEAIYGTCVDVFCKNAHWEGIVLDDTSTHNTQSIQKLLFFPDMGKEQSVPLSNLSLSSDWDEETGEWTLRGRWKFLEALEVNMLDRASSCMTVQQLWHIAKSHPYFDTEIGEWTCGTHNEWYSLLRMVYQLNHSTTSISVQSGAFSESVSDFVEGYRNKNSSGACLFSQRLKEKSDIARSHLKSVGWQFMETKGGTKYYVSTDGTRYDSFIKACEGYLSGQVGSPRQETTICNAVAGGMSEDKATRVQRGIWNPVKLIPEYSSQFAGGGEYGSVECDTVRKHLLHLGWIVECKRDTNRPMTRYRYHSPEGKIYYSLKLVFADVVSGFLSEKDGYVIPQSGALSESVSDFVEAYRNKKSSQAGLLSQRLKEKSDIARSHLKSVGWQFMETKGGTKYYVSTDGTHYDSFIKACEGYLSGEVGSPHQETTICNAVTGGMSEDKVTSVLHRQRGTWNPVKLIPEYSSQFAGGGEYGSVECDTVRKHLLHLGWIVEYKRDTNRPMTRYRYHSLEGKIYYSLKLVFADFINGFHSEKDGYVKSIHNESKPDQLMFNGGDQSGPNGDVLNMEMLEQHAEDHVLAEHVITDNILPGHLQNQIEYIQINCTKPESSKLPGNEENHSSPNGDYSHLQQPAGNEGNQLCENVGGSCYPRNSPSNIIQPGNLPESIREYIECLQDRIRSDIKGFIPPHVKSNARRHLLSAGWTRCMVVLNSKRPRLLYRSPSGKYFAFLLQACKAYLTEAFPASGDATFIMQERNISGKTSGPPSSIECGMSTSRRRHHALSSQDASMASDYSKSKRRKKSSDPTTLTKVREKPKKTKGKSNFNRETESNSPKSPSKHAKTALSLLMDKNVVMPRTRVSYQYGHFTKDGVITCNGIKCICCNKTFSATNFEVHAGGESSGRSLSNIYLRDGRSLLQCLVETMEMCKLSRQYDYCFKTSDHKSDSDMICSGCHNGGLLVKCCNCPSAFHPSCVGLKRIPKIYWCPFCCCRVCGSGVYSQNSDSLSDKAMVVCCEQCEGRFHVGCIEEGFQGLDCCHTEPWFCSTQCREVAGKLESLIGKKILTLNEGVTWSILKYSRWASDQTAKLEPEIIAEQHSKLYLAADVLNECFLPMTEPRTNSDLISDMIFNRESDLSRINFTGFYAIILEKGDEVVAAATLRVHGNKVAELPLVGTRVHYRSQGICRHLITVLEKVLSELKVEKLMLPSSSKQLKMWGDSFNFTEIDNEGLVKIIMHNLLTFPGSTLCQKTIYSV